MKSLKNSFIAVMLLFACNAPLTRPNSLCSILYEQARLKSDLLIVVTVNPNDCFSCVNALSARLQRAKSNILLVFRERREIEKKEVYKNFLDEIDTARVPVIWNDSLYEAVQNQYQGIKGNSILLVYDNTGRKLMCKPFKQVNGTEPELRNSF